MKYPMTPSGIIRELIFLYKFLRTVKCTRFKKCILTSEFSWSLDSVVDIATHRGWTVQNSNPSASKGFSLLLTRSGQLWAHPPSSTMGPGAPSRGLSGRGLSLTTHFHLDHRLRMSKTIPLFPFCFFYGPLQGDIYLLRDLHVFIACSVKVLGVSRYKELNVAKLYLNMNYCLSSASTQLKGKLPP